MGDPSEAGIVNCRRFGDVASEPLLLKPFEVLRNLEGE